MNSDAFDRLLSDALSDMHTAFPARIVAYDVDAQTVDVAPALLREVASDDKNEPFGFDKLPNILSVPVMWPRGGGMAITFPLKAGDWVLIVCAEQSTLIWRTSGGEGEHPGANDPFGLNGCVALPGWFPDVSRLANVSPTDLVIGDLESDATVRIKPDGTVVAGGEAGAGFVGLAEKIDAEFEKIAVTLGSLGGSASFAKPYATPGTVPSVAATKVKAR